MGFLIRGTLRPVAIGARGTAKQSIAKPIIKSQYPISTASNRVPSSISLKRQPGMRG